VCFVPYLEKAKSSRPDMMPTMEWKDSAGLFDNADFAHPCEVVGRHESSIPLEHAIGRKDSVAPVDMRYIVIVTSQKLSHHVRVEGVPRKAIQFFDDEYKSDNCLREAFRHEIHLPDHMVPEAWLDLK
jgi:hypothetical protein